MSRLQIKASYFPPQIRAMCILPPQSPRTPPYTKSKKNCPQKGVSSCKGVKKRLFRLVTGRSETGVHTVSSTCLVRIQTPCTWCWYIRRSAPLDFIYLLFAVITFTLRLNSTKRFHPQRSSGHSGGNRCAPSTPR